MYLLGGDDIKGVIFKLNGILFQDANKQKRAWMLFSLMEFFRDISHLDFDKYVYGQSYKSVMEYIGGRPLSNRKAEELAQKQECIYKMLCMEDRAHISLTYGAEFLLNELKERQIPRLLVIGTKKSNLDFYIESFKINEWFSQKNIIWADKFVPGKPDKDFYARAIQAINMPGENCIVFEDTVSGVQAAKKAGIGKIIVVAPKNKQYIFENMNEIDDIIVSVCEVNRFLLYEN